MELAAAGGHGWQERENEGGREGRTDGGREGGREGRETDL